MKKELIDGPRRENTENLAVEAEIEDCKSEGDEDRYTPQSMEIDFTCNDSLLVPVKTPVKKFTFAITSCEVLQMFLSLPGKVKAITEEEIAVSCKILKRFSLKFLSDLSLVSADSQLGENVQKGDRKFSEQCET